MSLGPEVARQVFGHIQKSFNYCKTHFYREEYTMIWPWFIVFSIFLALPFLSAPQMALFPCAGPLNLSEGVSSWISPQYRGVCVCVCTDEGIWAQIHERIQCK